jgi:hypothetical protein
MNGVGGTLFSTAGFSQEQHGNVLGRGLGDPGDEV